MATVNAEGVVTEIFAPVEAQIETLHELTGKTDKDFIGEAGDLDPKLKGEHHSDVQTAESAYRSVLKSSMERFINDESLPLNPFQKTVYYGSLKQGLNIVYRQPGATHPPVPTSTESVIDVAEANIETIDEIIEWWSNPAPYFAHVKNGAATIFPAMSGGNVRLSDVTYSSLSGNFTHPSIFAHFESGREVKFKEDKQIKVTRSLGDKSLSIGLYGWDGNHRATLDEFQAAAYQRYHFISPDEAITSNVIPGSEERFALRAAFGFLPNQAKANRPYHIEVEPPTPEFKDKFIGTIASSIIQMCSPEFLDVTVLKSRLPIRMGELLDVKLVERENTLTGMSFSDLGTYLRAADASISDVAETTRTTLTHLGDTEIITRRARHLFIRDDVENILKELVARCS